MWFHWTLSLRLSESEEMLLFYILYLAISSSIHYPERYWEPYLSFCVFYLFHYFVLYMIHSVHCFFLYIYVFSSVISYICVSYIISVYLLLPVVHLPSCMAPDGSPAPFLVHTLFRSSELSVSTHLHLLDATGLWYHAYTGGHPAEATRKLSGSWLEAGHHCPRDGLGCLSTRFGTIFAMYTPERYIVDPELPVVYLPMYLTPSPTLYLQGDWFLRPLLTLPLTSGWLWYLFRLVPQRQGYQLYSPFLDALHMIYLRI